MKNETTKNFDGKLYKYVSPESTEEANLILVVVNYNEVTNRVIVQPINCSLSIVPQSLVSLTDIKEFNY
jgi:hypothetical protein